MVFSIGFLFEKNESDTFDSIYSIVFFKLLSVIQISLKSIKNLYLHFLMYIMRSAIKINSRCQYLFQPYCNKSLPDDSKISFYAQ